MPTYVLGLAEIDPTRISEVGGKAAGLGELAKLPGIRVPDAFCVTTAAFERVLAEAPQLGERIDRLSSLQAEDHDNIRSQSAELRSQSAELRALIVGRAIPEEPLAAITRALARMGRQPLAVRSSATAEDLPTASFAGQQDSFLNVSGEAAVLQHIRLCWASLYTERAVVYRLRQGFAHRSVRMAVVVQRLILPQAAGVLFTADPLSSNRKVSSIEASFGLGDALVSGRVNPELYTVREGHIRTTIGPGARVTRALSGGEPATEPQPALSDPQLLELERLGRRIEAHFGQPQDIEWCLSDDGFYVVQSRPITTLFPIPNAGNSGNQVFLSVGHAQMMTDAMKPLGLSLFQLTAGRPMFAAGGRLFVDLTAQLSSEASRGALLEMMGRSDPLVRDALGTLLERDDFMPSLPGVPPARPPLHGAAIDPDPSVVPTLIQRSEAALQALKQKIGALSGPALLDCILDDVQALRQSLSDPPVLGAILAGMNAASWLNDKLYEWLGEKNAADALSQSVPNNVTSEMGLALLDVADACRPSPQVLTYLQAPGDADFLAGLAQLQGGPDAHAALVAWLSRYGMRCPGEIDVTRTRWAERPSALAPLLLSNLRTSAPGAAQRRFKQGLQVATEAEARLLARLRALPDGEQKAAETQLKIRQLRAFSGYREHPKYGIVNRYFVYKQALLAEAERLVQDRVIREREDIYYLTLQELRELVDTREPQNERVRLRKAEHERFRGLTPPRVITSEGEVVAGSYRRTDLPAGAIVGLAVSSGVVEGRARVVLDMADAALEAGDILVTRFTDPSWTPLFVAIRGLVTEVGGLMTHGAVIAREYGLPAVVGVPQATQRIRDGQRIRVHGTEGYVEILG